MKKEPFVTDKHLQMKLKFRTIGPLLLVSGALCLIISMVDFFTLEFFEEPKFFWLGFVGMPILFLGFIITYAGYGQDAAKYLSREMAPVTSETFNYIAEDTRRGRNHCKGCTTRKSRGRASEAMPELSNIK